MRPVRWKCEKWPTEPTTPSAISVGSSSRIVPSACPASTMRTMSLMCCCVPWRRTSVKLRPSTSSSEKKWACSAMNSTDTSVPR